MNARRHHPGQRPHGPTLGWAPKEHAFRFLAPKAARAWLVERAHPEDAASERVTEMTAFAHPQGLGFEVHQAHPHKYFRYRVQQGDETFDIADPRSTAYTPYANASRRRFSTNAPQPSARAYPFALASRTPSM